MTALRKAFELGPATQPIVAGLYAWAVTVAPVGFGRQWTEWTENWPAVACASLAFLALVRGAVTEMVTKDVARLERSRALTLISFVGSTLATWVLNQEALAPLKLGMTRGLAGMLGWGLFAYAAAAPTLEVPEGGGSARGVEPGLRARGAVARGDAVYVLAAAAFALGLQGIGWNIDVPERGLLVRVITVGAGVLLLGAMGSFVATRHGARSVEEGGKGPPRARARWTRPSAAVAWVIVLLLLLAAGVLYVLTNG